MRYFTRDGQISGRLVDLYADVGSGAPELPGEPAIGRHLRMNTRGMIWRGLLLTGALVMTPAAALAQASFGAGPDGGGGTSPQEDDEWERCQRDPDCYDTEGDAPPTTGGPYGPLPHTPLPTQPSTPSPRTPPPGSDGGGKGDCDDDKENLASFGDEGFASFGGGGCNPDPEYVTDCEECQDKKETHDEANDERRNTCVDRAEGRAARQCRQGRLRGQVSVPPESIEEYEWIGPFRSPFRTEEFRQCMTEWAYGWESRSDQTNESSGGTIGVEAGSITAGYNDAEGRTKIVTIGPNDGGYAKPCDLQQDSYNAKAEKEFGECSKAAEKKARDEGNDRFTCG